MASRSDLASKRQRFAAPIPEELVVEIYKRMPPESVGRSMCVCKAWKSLLSSPFFIALHHHHYSASTPEFQQQRLLLEKQPIPFPLTIRKKKPTPPRNFSGSTIESRCFPTVASHHDVPQLIGVVKGVACVLLISSEDPSTNTIILWNPLIRKYVELPDLPPPPEVNPKEISVGVGFLDDFRVIRVWKQFQDKMVYDVYSFKTGVWKRKVAENISLPAGDFPYNSGFFFKGTLNWILYPSYANEHFLFSVLMFDCEREEFRSVTLPEQVFGRAPFPKLAEFGGMLAFVRSKMWGMTTSISDSNSKVWMQLGDTPDHIANNDVFVSTGSLLLMDHAAAKPVVSLDDDSNGKAANRGLTGFLSARRDLFITERVMLVRLIGYCTEGSLFVVYEYVENGNLSQHLRGSGRDPLSWSARVQIALDSARGLEYIHEHTVPVYIHSDIKSANILIDQNFHGKVADFGLTKLTEAGTTRLVGTVGYMPPEYAQYGEVSAKVDVYALGVVLYELISGKEAVVKDPTSITESKGLVGMFEVVHNHPDPNEICKLIDPRMEDNYPLDAVLKMAQVAKACTNENPQLRPTMRSVAVALMTLSSATEDWNASPFYDNYNLVNLMSGR